MPGVMGGFLAGSIVAKMLLDKTGWNSSIAGVGTDVNNLKKHTKTLGDQFADLGKTLPKVGLAIVGTFGAMVLKTVEYQHELTHMSEKTGISVEDLSSFKLALEVTNNSLEDFTFSMKFLSNHMADAKAGNKAAIKTFNDLDVSFINIDGTLRPLKEVFIDVSDKFSKMEAGAKKNALAVDLFGRSGLNMIPTLNLGREGLEKFIDKAKELGLVVSTKSATAAAEMKEKMIELKLSFEAATQKLAIGVIPMLTKLVEQITEVVSKLGKWIEQHPELTKQLGETALKTGALMMATKLLTNPILAVAAAAAIAATMFLMLQDAEDKAAQASERYDAINAALGQRLREAADAAGLTRVQFHELSEKYKENYAAMAMAIEKGKEGVVLQQTLTEVGKKGLKIYDDQAAAIKKKAEEDEKGRLAMLGYAAGLGKVHLGLTNLATPLMTATQLQWNLDEGMKEAALDMNARLLPAIDNTKTSLMSLAMSLDMGDAFNKLGADSQKTINIVESGWESLYTDLATGWGNLISEFLAGGVTLNQFLSNVWEETKKAFFRVIGEMISKWLINLIKRMVESAIEGAASIGVSFGAMITSLASVLTTIATAVTTAIVTLATAIATAATILAAAAVPLLIVGGIALALYAGFSLISALFGGGGGGNDDITFWLKPISEATRQTADWLRISFMEYVAFWNDLFISDNFCLYELHGRLVETRDAVSYWGQAICDSIGKISHAQGGAIVMSPTLMAVGEQAPGIPEIILPEPIYERNLQMAAAMGGGQPGRPIELYINGEPVKFPMKENMRKIMVDLVPYMTKNEQLLIHPRSVRAF